MQMPTPDAGVIARRAEIAAALRRIVAPDAVIDVRVVIDADHRDVQLAKPPALARPRKGALGLIDYEKVFCVDPDPGRILGEGVETVGQEQIHIAHEHDRRGLIGLAKAAAA